MRKILLPVDGSENSLEAARHIIREYFNHSHMEIHLLNVQKPLSRNISRFVGKRDIDSWHLDQAEKVLKPCRELFQKHGIPYAQHIEKGTRAEVIVTAAKRLDCNLIVMSTARKNPLIRMLGGSITDQVLELTRTPVEIIVGKDVSVFERYVIPAGLGTGIAALLVMTLD